jgi:type IV pilus assembly protein PilA
LLKRLTKGAKGEAGFTLIELLVVVLILGLLANIAIVTFVSQRHKAQDVAAKVLVRSAMTAIESAYTEDESFAHTPAAMAAIEPTIVWHLSAADVTGISPLSITASSAAGHHDVDYFGGADTYSVATVSESGNRFGVCVDKSPSGGINFLKKMGAVVSIGW